MRAIPIDQLLDPEDGLAPRSGAAPEWNRLVAEGRAARRAVDGGAWRIGDLALQVERRYRSGALRRFAEAIGETPGTVRRLRWVAGIYGDAARRRFPELSFSHFQAVAGYADRMLWLERARRGAWSVSRLVAYAQSSERTPAPIEIQVRKPLDAAAKQIARIAEIDQRKLTKAARAGLAEAVAELEAQLDVLRARLLRNATARKQLKLVR
jgi:hypothetical protein